LHIRDFRSGENVDGDNVNGSSKVSATNALGSNLRILSLESYLPQRDQEILYIMQIYAKLDNFDIFGYSRDSWPTSAISPTVIASFMEYLLKMKSSNIAIRGNYG
jgi:hypothetical protein